jgi:hypothetical protein
MNIGARLEQASGPGEIILGESTYRLVRDAIEVERMPPLVLKGKSEAATAYRLIGARSDAEAVARRLDSPMVGRRDDLATLRRAFDRTQRDGGCRVVTIMVPLGSASRDWSRSSTGAWATKPPGWPAIASPMGRGSRSGR